MTQVCCRSFSKTVELGLVRLNLNFQSSKIYLIEIINNKREMHFLFYETTNTILLKKKKSRNSLTRTSSTLNQRGSFCLFVCCRSFSKKLLTRNFFSIWRQGSNLKNASLESPIPVLPDSDPFQFWHFAALTLSNYDPSLFWPFPISSKDLYFWKILLYFRWYKSSE